ncbi:hypothetical protein GHT06_012140 [Daphnia sinensis]|uniref:Uncharacterized protein n=1 Tax=Daphnia sinensis TaxID=1820382 RepID=A0AAD5KV67_9CRUS|nr:hypothetical protein GHT06_012140 [Daphnia sinensis]
MKKDEFDLEIVTFKHHGVTLLAVENETYFRSFRPCSFNRAIRFTMTRHFQGMTTVSKNEICCSKSQSSCRFQPPHTRFTPTRFYFHPLQLISGPMNNLPLS